MKKIISIDAETNGLWGTAFAIGAVIWNTDGIEQVGFSGRCPIDGEVNEWVKDNVLPQMEQIPVNYDNYMEMLNAFSEWYLTNKQDAEIIVHVGLPVEAKLFLDAHNLGYIGDWDAPFPLIDISAITEIGTSTDNYCKEHGIDLSRLNIQGGTHNPLYDCYSALYAYLYYRFSIE